MKVTYMDRSHKYDRPPLLRLEPENERDQTQLGKIHERRPGLVLGIKVNPLAWTYSYLEIRLEDEECQQQN